MEAMRRHRSAWLCVGLVLTFWAMAGLARASSAEDRYILLRDQAVARFAPLQGIDERVEAEEARVRVDLERRLRAILGPVRPLGFDSGKLNLTTLVPGLPEFGRLDGLLFETERGDREMIVTTRSLLGRWLRAQQDWPDLATQAPETAIRSEAFYTRVARVDAAAVRFAELPINAPAQQPAHAILAGRTQDRVPESAGGVFVAALKGERAFIANVALKPAFAIAACTGMRAEAEEKLAESLGNNRPTAGHGAVLLDRFAMLRDKIEADFLRCFAERALRDPRYTDAMTLAKELYDRMPAR
jgi:hypothetical protein